jgi:hypothetical protein
MREIERRESENGGEMLRVRERETERSGERESVSGRPDEAGEIRPLKGPVPGGWYWVVAGRAKADDRWNPRAPIVLPATRNPLNPRERTRVVRGPVSRTRTFRRSDPSCPAARRRFPVG